MTRIVTAHTNLLGYVWYIAIVIVLNICPTPGICYTVKTVMNETVAFCSVYLLYFRI